ncbi:AAA family ATPase [Clostridium algidicarnis]|uniref:AAA family ATPase n=1 Tax=Clostridium algidicarnis TaxID=37659 RepID=UPI001C0C5212|nr:ATP-binding protein [Clostridium algidicarnis]MBU3204400.1 AAA family ATPase [Clostridium algidicarnis]MBU3212517.1 AAA family ATPase [Clostridium algidicarnis]MBU3222948.1 AAA family ATPase [Clostridium algidicarnis]
MNENYITKIYIDKVRNLKDITIELSDSEKKHLILTGKNGSGKTSVLSAVKSYLKSIEENQYLTLINIDTDIQNLKIQSKDTNFINSLSESERTRYIERGKGNLSFYENLKFRYGEGLKLFLKDDNLLEKYKQGKFILAYFDAHRMTSVEIPSGVEKINLLNTYDMDSRPSSSFIKYLVDLKTQQAFAQNEDDVEVFKKIEGWFQRFEDSLKILMDDTTLKLKFDYKNYNFEIMQEDKEPYSFDKLSDGYSSVLNIIMDLILRMENNKREIYDVEGIVLIDEIETHLHLELQKKIMSFLTGFFPKLQFIVTTHSPFVLNSIDNAVIYDLEKNIKVEDLSNYSYEGIVEGYFNVDKYSKDIKNKLKEYEDLVNKRDLTDDERARRSELKIELKEISSELAVELKLKFEEIEMKRANLYDKDK